MTLTVLMATLTLHQIPNDYHKLTKYQGQIKQYEICHEFPCNN